MKILNLYAGIGGNRNLWGNEHEITAVEINPEVAEIYKSFFPNDTVIVGDAHQYLLEHHNEFDFIWSSPQCQTHSKFRKNIACSVEQKDKGRWANPVYPDLSLYQEIIFLQHYFKGKWIVENVVAYYEPLIKPKRIQRHWIWSNFPINEKKFNHDNIMRKTVDYFDLSGFKVSHRRKGQSRNEVLEKDQILRNCVKPELGLYIMESAFKQRQEVLA